MTQVSTTGYCVVRMSSQDPANVDMANIPQGAVIYNAFGCRGRGGAI